MWRRRDQILRAGDRRAENLALMLAGYVRQTFGTADAALRQLVLHSRRVGGPHASQADWLPALEAATGGLQAVGAISVVDTSGIIRHSTQPTIVGQNRRDHFVFARLAADTADVMVADPPFRTVVDERRFIIPLARRLTSTRGTFDGIIVASFIPDSLREFFRTVDVGREGAIGVFHTGGVVLFREPSTRNPLGDEVTGHPLFEAAQRLGGVGAYRGRVQSSGPMLRTAFRSLPEERLIVAVSRSEAELLREWRRDATMSLVVGLVIAAGLAAFLGLLFHQMDVRARAEQALVRSQRLESLGQLTGGVAHDFNNLLTVILGNASLLRTAGTAGGSRGADDSLAEIERAAGRAADLTRQLLAFARRQPLVPRVIDLSAVVAAVSSMLRRVVGDTVTLKTVAPSHACLANVDPVQVETALLNLCLNARDAMSGGGTVIIETSSAVLDDHDAREAPDVVPGRYSLITVSDTGAGIHPDHLPRLFEPFFTTRAPGKGTGLGLSMVYGFVKQSGGHVRVYSEIGRGTAVKLYFPEATGDVTAEVTLPPPRDAPRGNGEVVLLVEDDAQVRELAVRLLRRLGYGVLEATDAQRALAVARSASRVDLLLTDVMLPGPLSGTQLAAEVTRERPGLPVLYASGYSSETIQLGTEAGAARRFLAKPYDRQRLASAVHEALTERSASER